MNAPARPFNAQVVRARTRLTKQGIAALLSALLLGVAACAPRAVILEQRDGIVVTLRPERKGTRAAPGPEFANLTDSRIEYSLRRLVIRPSKLVVFLYGDPVALLNDEQIAVIGGLLLRELPQLPQDKRLGFAFRDSHKRNDVDVEIYPEDDRLVYEFRALLRQRREILGPGERNLNEAIVFPQRTQLVEEGEYTLVKDDITSVARAELRLLDEEEQRKEDDRLF